MKKYLVLKIVLVLSLFVFVGLAEASYNWRPAKELTESDYSLLFASGVREIQSPIAKFARVGENVIALQLQNGETVLAGSGGGQTEKRRTTKDSFANNFDNSSQTQEKDEVFIKAEILNRLVLKFEMATTTAEKDELFSQLLSLIRTYEWSNYEVDISYFRILAESGKRYSFQAIEMLSQFNTQYPGNNYLIESLDSVLNHAISSYYALPEEKPTAHELRILAETLLSHYQNNPNYVPSFFANIRAPLELAAPDILKTIDELESARYEAREAAKTLKQIQ